MPQPKSESIVSYAGKKYLVLSFEFGQGPTLQQTIEIAKARGLPMLTSDEARSIITYPNESNPPFGYGLKHGAFCYVRDPKSEKSSMAAVFVNGIGGLYCYDNHVSDIPAKAVVLVLGIDEAVILQRV